MAHCEYDNGYLVFDASDAFSGKKEVWRLASDFAEGEVATHSPPDEGQRRVSGCAAAMHNRYAPRGHFRPWATLSFPELTFGTRLVYPTLLSANTRRAFLHDVHTGALMQTIDVGLSAQVFGLCYVDVNERYAFVCESRALHVLARDDGAEVLRIPNSTFVPKSRTAALVSEPVPENPFVEVLSLRPGRDNSHQDFLAGAFPSPSPLRLCSYYLYVFCAETRQVMTQLFCRIAHVSRDGRDLAILDSRDRLLLVRDFERVCRGEISLANAAQVLYLLPRDRCFYLAFEHGRVCIATVSFPNSSIHAPILLVLTHVRAPFLDVLSLASSALHRQPRQRPFH